ncbi:MAG TPA: M3 family oligoendopeptidase [Thermoanaerobaculia bacterium]|nr:M3 family oligoendopeptidase [Thermoanaerobaculia bacterium]
MTASVLPSSPVAFSKAGWSDIAPYFDDLAERPLDAGTVDEWLRAWSRLEELVTEAAAEAMIAYTIDTSDPEKEKDHLRFSTEILPKMEERSVELARRFVALGYETPELATTLARFRTSIEIFREANVPIFAELEELSARYQRITGSMTVEWDGVERPLPQLQPFLKSADRAVRERAFRSATQPYIEERSALAGLFDRMYELRQRAARNAGFANYRDYVFPAKFRFDYTPADCERFHEAVERSATPAVARVLEHRRQRLGLDALRPWDLAVDPYRAAPLRPFQTVDEFTGKARRVFDEVDPVLGRQFQTMIDERLLDLDSRKGKAPGGYCETLHFRGRPFIFMNAVGLVDDVMTLLHEAGHAFHALASHRQPLIWQRHPGSEAAELASMSMELLASPHLAQPTGYFTPEDHRGAWLEHLEDVLLSLVHIASVDAFQTWIYTSPDGGDAAARDEAWLRIRSRFERGVDWTGLETERVARWYRQLHIFMYPFYYIEYGIAQLGALQIWRNSLRDRSGAVARYRQALALGAVRSLPEMYRAAGAKLTFDANLIGELVQLVEEKIEAIRAELPSSPA